MGNSDNFVSYKVPVSVKGIIFDRGKVWLRKNQRGEWELPGGKLDEGEQPKKALIRELKEELGFDVKIRDIVSSDLYTIKDSIDESRGVFVVSYLCRIIQKSGGFEVHGDTGRAEFKSFEIEDISGLNMPQFYKDVIKKANNQV